MLRFLQIISLCFILNSCIFGTSQTPTFYTLTSQSNDTILNNYKLFIGLSRVQLPKYVDRPQIVTQKTNSNEVIISEYNRWLEGPSTLMTRILIDNLNTLLPNAQIKMRQVITEKFDMIVNVDVIKMNAILGKQIEFDVLYVIKNQLGEVVVQEKFTDKIEIGKSYNDLVVGYSNLLNELSKNISYSLIKNFK